MPKPNQFWNVQPYRFVDELTLVYTRTVFQATRNKSEAMAAEAKKWMKQNAPWTDRPDGPGSRRAREGIQTPHARAGLTAFVVGDKEEDAREEALMAVARNEDALLLDQRNLQAKGRKEAAEKRVKILRASDEKQKSRRLQRNIKRQKQYRRRQSLPKSLSAVEAAKKAWKGQRAPLVDIVFSYDRDVHYSVWLELANGGRYSIIGRAVQHWAPKFMTEIKRIANLKQYRDKLSIRVNPTPEEAFEEFAHQESVFKGRPYKPWSAEIQAERARRRPQYNADEARARREANLAYEEVKGNKRRLGDVQAEHMSINIRRSR